MKASVRASNSLDFPEVLESMGCKSSHSASMNFGVVVALLLYAAPASPQTSTPGAQQPAGVVNGTIVDDTGSAIPGAAVTLRHEGGSSQVAEVSSRADGRFSFSNIPSGPFRLTVSAPGFADQTLSGSLAAGEVSNLPPIRMTLALSSPAVDVTPTRVELAQRQIEEQEQQRLFGVFPNFFVSYDPDALPLTAKQKFELSWKSRLDPVQFGVVGIVAGVQQARNSYSGFGQGAEGYAKRYAAAYANVMTRSLLTQVLLPSLFRQDPRYFYKGTGSRTSRVVYALTRAVIRKGDNGRWQPNYSGILGNVGSGALSNFYYPAEDRKSIRLTLENTAIGLGGAAAGRLAQEFLFKKLTSRSSRSNRPVTVPPASSPE
jgi:Carboxypeptidase regulatory-like domain